MFSNSALKWTWAAIALAGVYSFQATLTHAEAPGPKDEQAKEEARDPYELPDGDTDELIEFMQRMKKMKPRVRTRKELMAHRRKSATAIIAASNKILGSGPPEETAVDVAAAKLGALKQLVDLRESGALEQLGKYAGEVAIQEKADSALLGKQYLLFCRAESWDTGSAEEEAAFVTQATELFESGVDATGMGLIMGIGQALERKGQTALAVKFYPAMGPRVMESENENIARLGRKFEGIARRLQLVGNKIDIEGTLLDGKELDWSAYEGKVVLVDFWATWCGPCIAELPNVKKSYDQYHNKGFEVVGISLDTSKERVSKFLEAKEIPWPALFSEDEEATGWDHPMAVRYGVLGIPFAVLVGKDGAVVTASARGSELPRQLGLLLGPPEETASDTTSAAYSTTGKRFFHDSEIKKLIEEGGRKLVEGGKTAKYEELARQLEKKACALTLAEVSQERETPAETYEQALPGVLVVADVYRCGRCPKWHSDLSSSFLISASGAFVLNYHQVANKNRKGKNHSMVVMTLDGAVLPVKEVLAADKQNDVVIAQLETGGRKLAPLALATDAPVGSPVTVISHPTGRPYTLTHGRVSRYYRESRKDGTDPRRMAVTADFAKGSSGAPLFNEYGNVVGMVSTTSSVYHSTKNGIPRNLQMVIKQAVPAEAILHLIER